MSFFKPSTEPSSNKNIRRLHSLIWALIYGGLLTLVLGFSLQRTDDALGWTLVTAGGVVAAAGFVLIYVRSRMRSEP
ncbi:MAG: hypothetical protein JWP47_2218 [Polaromonas sp.]|jgi:hypothetical protein|nr:hypothetical protein [Polaromonas sp.]